MTCHERTRHLADLLRREHLALADFLVALADFDRQRAWVELGYSSLFHFLHRELRLSKGAAHTRLVAAQLLQRIPEVIEPIRDGRLCLSSVSSLAKVVTPENAAEMLQRFFHTSKREAMEITAELSPRSAPHRVVVTACTSRVETARMLPSIRTEQLRPDDARVCPGEPDQSCGAPTPVRPGEPTQPSPAPAPVRPGEPTQPSPAPALVRPGETGVIRTDGRSNPARTSDVGSGLVPAAPIRARTELEPLTADLRRLHVTVSKRFLKKLDAARDALSHSRPGATVEEVLETGLDLLLDRHTKRRGLVDKPRRPRTRTPSRRPAAASGASSSRACALANSHGSIPMGVESRVPNAGAGSVSIVEGKAPASDASAVPPATAGVAHPSAAGAALHAAASSGRSRGAGDVPIVESALVPDANAVLPTRGSASPPAGAGAELLEVTGAGLSADADAALVVEGEAPTSVHPGREDVNRDGIPASVRREVWIRDGGCCQWPLSNGGICGSTVRVQFDHVIPRGKGGTSDAGNVRLLCAMHNRLAARLAFGDRVMDRYTARPGDPPRRSQVGSKHSGR